jgi:uncharacterized protein YigA (DUF484 family)
MNKNSSTAKAIDSSLENELTSEQVVQYLRSNKDFFHHQSELLADLSLPHESGKAISLVEKQVSVLRHRGQNARKKLSDLLENAGKNDRLFDTTRSLVLALLRAQNITEIVAASQDQLSNQENVDACEIILLKQENLTVPPSVRTESLARLKNDYSDVFRLRRTHCGPLSAEQISYLFLISPEQIQSTAMCPIVGNGDILGLIAFGNQTKDYFNIHLDTLFLDFIGNVIGAVLASQSSPAHS